MSQGAPLVMTDMSVHTTTSGVMKMNERSDFTQIVCETLCQSAAFQADCPVRHPASLLHFKQIAL